MSPIQTIANMITYYFNKPEPPQTPKSTLKTIKEDEELTWAKTQICYTKYHESFCFHEKHISWDTKYSALLIYNKNND